MTKKIKILSIPKLAEKIGVSTEWCRKNLQIKGYIKRTDNQWELTKKGQNFGGTYRNHYGRYIAFPENITEDIHTRINAVDNHGIPIIDIPKRKKVLDIPLPNALGQAMVDIIQKPIFNRTGTSEWKNHISNKIQDNGFDRETNNFHRKKIVKQGQADFTSSSHGLNPDEIVLLYCYYYFQMHYSSTVAVLRHLKKRLNELFNNSKKVIFIDLGCGPMTSGISFLDFINQDSILGLKKERDSNVETTKLEYYGWDISKSMLVMGSTLGKSYSHNGNLSLRYSTAKFYEDLDTLSGLPNDNGNETTIILNACYLFASQSLDMQHFNKSIERIVNRNSRSKILFIYQNADTTREQVTGNYKKFISNGFKSIKYMSNVNNLKFKFSDALGSSIKTDFIKTVKYSIIVYGENE